MACFHNLRFDGVDHAFSCYNNFEKGLDFSFSLRSAIRQDFADIASSPEFYHGQPHRNFRLKFNFNLFRLNYDTGYIYIDTWMKSILRRAGFLKFYFSFTTHISVGTNSTYHRLKLR